ncbi:predicted protein [Histoplasma capsulatum var. duboisii H88]|uniref:Predicted protein n=1 Tax=Ajellomyces capsulatus (strain H88) TaxID=544711 RepID=F0U808_AJEC8|nr:predicted protein [Histoplasma capsulatum var. duboisii H88]
MVYECTQSAEYIYKRSKSTGNSAFGLDKIRQYDLISKAMGKAAIMTTLPKKDTYGVGFWKFLTKGFDSRAQELFQERWLNLNKELAQTAPQQLNHAGAVKSAAELAQYPLRCCNYRKLSSRPTTHLRRTKKAVKHHGPGITVDRSCPLPGSDDQGDGPSRSIFLAHEHHHKGRTGDAACDGFAETQIQ